MNALMASCVGRSFTVAMHFRRLFAGTLVGGAIATGELAGAIPNCILGKKTNLGVAPIIATLSFLLIVTL